MGQLRTAKIQDWQQRAGINPASGARRETLDRMSDLAFELIKVIALEGSGIRDGDGYWSGCDPIAHIMRALVEADRQPGLQAWDGGTFGRDPFTVTPA